MQNTFLKYFGDDITVGAIADPKCLPFDHISDFNEQDSKLTKHTLVEITCISYFLMLSHHFINNK